MSKFKRRQNTMKQEKRIKEIEKTGFIGGGTPLDDLQTQQARLSSINPLITDLDSRRNDLTSQLAEAAQLESDYASLEKATTIAIEAAAGISEYVQLRNEFDQIIRTRTEQLFDQLQAIRGFQKQYKEILEPVDGLKIGLRVAPGKVARFEEVRRELRRKEMSDDVIKWAHTELNVPPLESDLAFQVLLDAEFRKREIEARRKAQR